ncbi:MAG: phosphoenolpyruvate carboxylase, partial [Luminiphilus sp.]
MTLDSSIDTTQLRKNVRLLGDILGQVIRTQGDPGLFDAVESIRQQSKQSQEDENHDTLRGLLKNLDDKQILDVAKAFSHFLNLANIAEQHHTVAADTAGSFSAAASLENAFETLVGEYKQERIEAVTDALSIDLVLTAHPTEITRRTLIHKHGEINDCLSQLEMADGDDLSSARSLARLKELITQLWHTEEFRTDRPTPIDEARWGFAVIENSLWDAVPSFLRTVDRV